MDLIVGHLHQEGFSTCVFAEDYNSCIRANRHFANVAGDEIQVLAVFLNKGSLAKEIHCSLQDHFNCRVVGWYNASPGQINDMVHGLIAPGSVSNTWARSLDNQVPPPPSQSDDPTVKAKGVKKQRGK